MDPLELRSEICIVALLLDLLSQVVFERGSVYELIVMFAMFTRSGGWGGVTLKVGSVNGLVLPSSSPLLPTHPPASDPICIYS